MAPTPSAGLAHFRHARARHEQANKRDSADSESVVYDSSYTAPTTPTPTTSGISHVLYTPTPIPIRNLLLPPTIPARLSQPVHGRNYVITGGEIAFIVAASLLSIISCLVLAGIIKTYCVEAAQKKKRSHNEHLKAKITIPKIVISDDFDDSTWGTPSTRHSQFLASPVSIPPTTPPGLPYSLVKPAKSSSPLSNAVMQQQQETFEHRMHSEEADIALALDLALRDSDFDDAVVILDNASEQEYTDLTILAGTISAERRVNRTMIPLPAPFDSRISSVQFESTSTISFNSTVEQDPDEEDDEEEGEVNDEEEAQAAEIFEVKRAHARSLEVKQGALLAWSTLESCSVLPLPRFVISEAAGSPLSASSSLVEGNDDNGLLHPYDPNFLVTHPSLTSIESSVSATSVDLADFPTPPPSLPEVVPQIEESESGGSWDATAVKKRSTVERFIMMYDD